MTTLINALPGMPAYPAVGLGFEEISRAAFLLMKTQLNDELLEQTRKWEQADLAMAELGASVAQVDITPVPDENFHDGPRRSLIEAPPAAFPNVTVMAFQSVPDPDQGADHVLPSEFTLFVETMAISGPVVGETTLQHEAIVHRRIQRMTEAVATIIGRNQTLLGTIQELHLPPRGGIGNASVLQSTSKGAGPNHIWHGSRLQYTMTRYNAIP